MTQENPPSSSRTEKVKVNTTDLVTISLNIRHRHIQILLSVFLLRLRKYPIKTVSVLEPDKMKEPSFEQFTRTPEKQKSTSRRPDRVSINNSSHVRVSSAKDAVSGKPKHRHKETGKLTTKQRCWKAEKHTVCNYSHPNETIISVGHHQTSQL